MCVEIVVVIIAVKYAKIYTLITSGQSNKRIIPPHSTNDRRVSLYCTSFLSQSLSLQTCRLVLMIQQQQQQEPFYGSLSGTTQVSRYKKKHSPTHHPDHHPIFISFFHLPRSIAFSLFKLRAWQSFCTTSFHVLFGLPLGLEPSTLYSIHFFTQSVSSFRNTCPYHHNLFCCSINIISSIPSLSLNSLLETLYFTLTFYPNITHPSDHSHLCWLKCHLIFFRERPGLTSV